MKQVDDGLVSNIFAFIWSKTKFMVLTRSQEHKQTKINVFAATVGKVTQVKYMELVLTTN